MSMIRSIKQQLKIHQNYHKGTKIQKKIISKNNFTYRFLVQIFNNYLINEKKSILDVGCGAGSISLYLADKGHDVTGIDISQKAIAACKKSAIHLGFENVNFIRSSFPEEIKIKKKFDVVVLTEVIEHLPDDKKALKEIYKLLKPNGLLFLSTPSIIAPLHRLGLTKKFDEEVGHLRRYSLLDLKRLLRSNGFKILEVKKNEGILRNFLFVNPIAGKLVRIINKVGSDFVTILDNFTLKVFGESNYIIVARKNP